MLEHNDLLSVAGPFGASTRGRRSTCTSYLISPDRLSVFDHLHSSSVHGAGHCSDGSTDPRLHGASSHNSDVGGGESDHSSGDGSNRGSGDGSTRGSGDGSTRGFGGGFTRGSGGVSFRGSGSRGCGSRGSGGVSSRGSGGRGSDDGSARGSDGGSIRGSDGGSARGSTRGSDGGSIRGSDGGSARGSDGSSMCGSGHRTGHGGIGGSSTPYGYATPHHPVIGGPDPCPHCFSSPCIVSNPPSFLVGSSVADVRNANKRYPLYRKFWRLLKDIGLWNYEPYLVRKSARTSRADVREIIPSCVTNVNKSVYTFIIIFFVCVDSKYVI